MVDQSKAQESVGQIMKVEVPITISIILAAAVLGLTSLFIWESAWRPEIEFFGISAGVAAGILSAYYVGRGLRITIDQRQKALTDEKIARAFECSQRWNDPSFAKMREEWRALLVEIEDKQGADACGVLDCDQHKRSVAADVLNFFEELAYAAKSGVADLETLKNTLRSIVVRYYSAISPWIEKVRRDNKQKTAYEHFEWLSDQWK